MDCTLNESLICIVCGRAGKLIGGVVRRQMCQAPCTPPQAAKCPTCSTALVKKRRLPEAKWVWRCVPCRVDVRECVPCNAKAAR